MHVLDADPGRLPFSGELWQAARARGYDDVTSPLAALFAREDGFVIYAKRVGPGRAVIGLDTGSLFWGVVIRGDVPPLGARVRISPAAADRGATWTVRVLAALTAGVHVAFPYPPIQSIGNWAARLRTLLADVRELEAKRRRELDAMRRALPPLVPVPTLHDELHALDLALRAKIDAQTQPTPDERAAFERAGALARKRLIGERAARRLERYGAEVAALRERMPDIVLERERRIAANIDVQLALQHIEDVHARSRSVSEGSFIAAERISAIERAGLCVSVDARLPERTQDHALYPELARSIDLLFALVTPRVRAYSSVSSA